MKVLFQRVSVLTESLERWIISVAILLMMVNSVANALGRYLFSKSLFFSEELNQFLIVSVTFIGFAYAVRKGRNIRMTAVYDSLSFNGRKLLIILISAATALLMFYLAYKAFFYVQELKQINRLSPALQFPVYLVYAVIPLGLSMAGIQYLIALYMNLTHPEIYLSHDVVDG